MTKSAMADDPSLDNRVDSVSRLYKWERHVDSKGQCLAYRQGEGHFSAADL